MSKITKGKNTNNKPETPRKDNNTTNEVTELKAIVESLQSKVTNMEEKVEPWRTKWKPWNQRSCLAKIPVTSCQRSLINNLLSSTNYISIPDGTVLLYPEFPSKK